MVNLLDSVEIPRKEMILFFVLDVSGSMSGTNIQSLNQAVSEVIPMIKDISSNNSDALIKLAVLSFSSGVEWMYDEPKEVSDFLWSDLSAWGSTDFGSACSELNKKLSRKEFMKSDSGAFAPVIILISDGYPTDEYEENLNKLKENKWFKHAIKVAISIDSGTDDEVLIDFSGSSESVVKVTNVDALKKIIRIVSITSSTVASQSATGDKTKQQMVEEGIENEVAITDGASYVDKDDITMDDDWD